MGLSTLFLGITTSIHSKILYVFFFFIHKSIIPTAKQRSFLLLSVPSGDNYALIHRIFGDNSTGFPTVILRLSPISLLFFSEITQTQQFRPPIRRYVPYYPHWAQKSPAQWQSMPEGAWCHSSYPSKLPLFFWSAGALPPEARI